MLIQAFEWDDGNLAHIGKHGVDPDEVEELLSQPHHQRRSWDGYYIALGRSAAGRHLTVIFAYRGAGVARPFSARDMNRWERRLYREHK